MKVVISLLILLPFALTGPALQQRRYFVEEEDPNFKRYIYVENDKGQYEMLDLAAGEVETRVSVSDVEYDLYTGSNQNSPTIITGNNVNTLSRSNFNPSRQTIFVAHGWTNHRGSEVNSIIRNAVFSGNHDVNLFIVDWSPIAGKNYISAKGSVVAVGQVVGAFVNSIQSTYGIDGSNMVLVGHSLGAHVVGSAGATINKKVHTIIGLDPAGPLFSINNTGERLDPTDADVVQVIHTNGNLLGFGSSIGDIDYYPNGGMTQPGCGWDLAGTCAHSKAYKYLAEALVRGSVFQGRLCADYKTFSAGTCRYNTVSVMGQYRVPASTFGDYFLDTNADEPFGLH